MPVAPGTFGTLAGIPVFLLLSLGPWWVYFIGLAALIAAAVYFSGLAQNIHGRHDDGRIVIDEVAGYVAAMTGVSPGLVPVAIGFVLFRIFDIFKPWPCRFIDRNWKSGTGVVFDDLAAGLYAALLLRFLLFLWPVLGRVRW